MNRTLRAAVSISGGSDSAISRLVYRWMKSGQQPWNSSHRTRSACPLPGKRPTVRYAGTAALPVLCWFKIFPRLARIRRSRSTVLTPATRSPAPRCTRAARTTRRPGPTPLFLNPPNGASMLRPTVFTPTPPARSRRATRKARATSPGPDVVDEAVVAVVGEGDALLLVVEGDDHDDRAEDLLADHAHVGACSRRGGSARRRSPRSCGRAVRRPRPPRAPSLRPSSTYDSTRSRWAAEITGPTTVSRLAADRRPSTGRRTRPVARPAAS